MNQVPLTLENLQHLNFGLIGKIFAQQLKALVKDCEDRPMEASPRKISVSFFLTPELDENDPRPVCDTILVACDVVSGVPKTKTRIFSMKPKQDGQLVFNPDVPEDAEAEGLYDPKTGEVR